MKYLKLWLLMTMLVLGAFSAQALGPAGSSIRSYKEWKSDKVQAALNQILDTRNLILKAQTENNLKTADSLRHQLGQLQWNLEVANDLSVTDYFVLYLSQQSVPDRFQQAAQKLAATEVAELMEAYSGVLGMNPTAPGATSAKLPSQATKN